MTTSPRSEDHERTASFLTTIAEKSCRKRLAGIAIGVVVDGQELTACSGWADVESQRPVSESTVFEIGSISKLFTSLLLAVAVTKRELALDDPVQAALGEQVTLPTDGVSQITYRSLANHRSSLPRLPDDLLATADMANPYVHYDQEMLYACLNRMESLKPIGSRGEYSNFGVGLLGHALGKLAGSDYRTALTERVLMPLGMRNTSTESSDEQAAQLATAHMKKNKPTKHWDFTEVTVGAGGVRSPLSDMFKFLRANIDTKNSKLADALKLMREPSTLPECDSKPGSFTRSMYVLPFVWLTLLLGIFAGLFGALHWLSGIAVGYQLIPIMVLTFVAAILRGMTAGTLTLAVLTFLTWWYWKDGYDWIMNLLLGPSLIYMGSAWKDEFAKRGGGEGRLAWHSSEVGGHQMLWHNGMVGGSASFLSIVPELEIGVIVLTNTANSVDAIGVKIMSELVKLKEEQPSA